MDEALEKALDFSNYMVTFNNQKRIIREEFLEDLLIYQNGGMFTITKELICFIEHLTNTGNTKSVIIDDNNTPILIKDLSKFMYDVKIQYQEVSTKYYEKYQKMVDKRNVESIVDV
tara:strand:- start:2496 stop:2843 length:348 start_codon:yes stop_codon:yes gene_type:complete